MGSKKEYNQKYYQENKEKLKASAREWHQQNRGYANERSRDYQRKRKAENPDYERRTVLTTRDKNGKQITIYGLNKRPYTWYCEICRVTGGRLHYHHWDDNNYSKGIWVCYKCHILVEMIDGKVKVSQLVDIYKELKGELDAKLGTQLNL